MASLRPPGTSTTRTPRTAGETALHLATNKGTKFNKALDIARNKQDLAEAVRNLEDKFYADSNKAPQARKEADVLELVTAITAGAQAFPLTPKTVKEFGATLLSAEYKSAEQYLGALKLAHVERDHPVTPALKRTFDLTRRALARDKAKANRAPEFQIEDFPIDAVVQDLLVGELAFPVFTYGLALAFMLRLCELVQLTWKDLEWDDHKVTIHIKKSKTDQAGKGVKRTLGCTCRSSPATCPVELIKNFAAAADKAVPGHRVAGGQVACTTEGYKVSKGDGGGFVDKGSGHPTSRTRAMFYVRAGLTIAEVTYLGRWHSDLVFQYGEEAWEGRPMNEGSQPVPAKKPADNKKPLPEPRSEPATEELVIMDPGQQKAALPAQTIFAEELQTTRPKWVRTSGRSKVVHLLGEHAGNSSATWKTKCGWPFARACHFTLYVIPPLSIPKCRSCRMRLGKSRGEPGGVKIACGRRRITERPLWQRFLNAPVKRKC